MSLAAAIAALASAVRQPEVAGTDADDRETAAPAADRLRGQSVAARARRRRSHAATCALARSAMPFGPAAASAAPSATPQQPVARNTASERSVRRVGLGKQPLGGKNRAGTPSVTGERVNAGLGELQIDRDDRRDGIRSETRRSERRAREIGDLLGRTAALASDAERQYRRVIDERRGFGAGERSVTMTLTAARSAQSIAPARSHSPPPTSSTNATGSPARSAAAIGLTRSALAIRQPGGGSSSAKPSRRSPAVVIAAVPPMTAAIARAIALAP